MKFPKYEKYKESGVEWLGEVPEHWRIVPLRFALLNQNFKRIPISGVDRAEMEKAFPYYGASGIIDYVDNFIFEEPSILVAEDGANLLSRSTPLAFIASCKYWVNNHAHILSPLAGDIRFWAGTLQTFDYTPLITGAAQPKLTADRLGSILLPYPPDNEQNEIANFLERETTRLDTLIAKKKELVEKLQEQRSALISRTVTKGLPADIAQEFGLAPHSRFKPSGVDWLGDIPEGWEVKRFSHVSVVVRGGSPRPAGDPRFFDGDFIPWITVAEITKDKSVFLTSTKSMLTQEGALYSRKIEAGTLVLSNSGATLGVPKILKISGCANDGVVAFESLSKECDIIFLFYYLSSLTTNLRERIKQGGGQPNLNTDIVKSLQLPVPQLLEQTIIATYLDKETAKMDNLIAKTTEAIDRVQEYRSALITAAVTGKIDVRNIALNGVQ